MSPVRDVPLGTVNRPVTMGYIDAVLLLSTTCDAAEALAGKEGRALAQLEVARGKLSTLIDEASESPLEPGEVLSEAGGWSAANDAAVQPFEVVEERLSGPCFVVEVGEYIGSRSEWVRSERLEARASDYTVRVGELLQLSPDRWGRVPRDGVLHGLDGLTVRVVVTTGPKADDGF